MSAHNFAYSKTREQDLALMLAAGVITIEDLKNILGPHRY